MQIECPAKIEPNSLYTTDELAAYLKIEPDTLSYWRIVGRYPILKYKRVGGSVRYLGEDILAFLAQDPTKVKAQAESYPQPKNNPRSKSPRPKSSGSRRRKAAR